MARFFAFFKLFHLSLTFFRPEVPFDFEVEDLEFEQHRAILLQRPHFEQVLGPNVKVSDRSTITHQKVIRPKM